MKRFIMKVAITGTVLASMLGSIAPAQATPRFGQRYTRSDGYIVWVKGDYAYSRVRCTWWAGQNWSLNYSLAPREYKFTTSDAGGWGNTRPQGLDCTYHRG